MAAQRPPRGPETAWEVLAGGLDQENAEHVFATIDSVASRQLVARFGGDYWHTVVIDECHRLAADRFREFASAIKPAILLGLTATPEPRRPPPPPPSPPPPPGPPPGAARPAGGGDRRFCVPLSTTLATTKRTSQMFAGTSRGASNPVTGNDVGRDWSRLSRARFLSARNSFVVRPAKPPRP
ncbi:MAG: DEAD/DEAH box helicase family protein [Betaproteobacteria bacterium]|nr:DEAD/DEAH box helicase family protein [Betaproteobacteria bacterium]